MTSSLSRKLYTIPCLLLITYISPRYFRRVTQNFKLTKLLESKIKNDAKYIIYNFSSHILTKNQEALLIKGLNYAMPPKKLRYEDYLINFELLYRDLTICDVSNEKLFWGKNEIRNLPFSSFNIYSKIDHK